LNLSIRTAESRKEALERAVELERWAGEIAPEFLGGPLAPGSVARMVDRHFDAPETVVVSAHAPDGECLGMLVTAPLEDPLTSRRYPLIVLLHVEPRFRHRGVAGKLVAGAIEHLGRRGVPRIAARAAHNDDALISMAERWGFVRHFELMLRE
jgi:GNAT superfamily N-acetyltransferase